MRQFKVSCHHKLPVFAQCLEEVHLSLGQKSIMKAAKNKISSSHQNNVYELTLNIRRKLNQTDALNIEGEVYFKHIESLSMTILQLLTLSQTT